jgi:hypothetical protein
MVSRSYLFLSNIDVRDVERMTGIEQARHHGLARTPMVNFMNTQTRETLIGRQTIGFDRGPVDDGIYFATLRPPVLVPFVETGLDLYRGRLYKRINLDATDLRRVDDDVPCTGIAYGYLESRRRRFPTSSLTDFLKTFGLYVPGSSTSKRVNRVKEFIQSQPRAVVVTRWVGYSCRQRRTVARRMSQFPSRGDGLYEPTLILEDGEVITAKARIAAYYTVEACANIGRFFPNVVSDGPSKGVTEQSWHLTRNTGFVSGATWAGD